MPLSRIFMTHSQNNTTVIDEGWPFAAPTPAEFPQFLQSILIRSPARVSTPVHERLLTFSRSMPPTKCPPYRPAVESLPRYSAEFILKLKQLLFEIPMAWLSFCSWAEKPLQGYRGYRFPPMRTWKEKSCWTSKLPCAGWYKSLTRLMVSVVFLWVEFSKLKKMDCNRETDRERLMLKSDPVIACVVVM